MRRTDGAADGWLGRDAGAARCNSPADILHAELIADAGLVDATASEPAQFTFERQRAGKPSKFRCDLALIADHLLPATTVRYDHGTRTADTAFTGPPRAAPGRGSIQAGRLFAQHDEARSYGHRKSWGVRRYCRQRGGHLAEIDRRYRSIGRRGLGNHALGELAHIASRRAMAARTIFTMTFVGI